VFGSLLAAEGVFAFFLEGGFLGLMLFGGNRLGPKMWLAATSLVVFGAHFSAIWIIMANSWMQTPAGYTISGFAYTGQGVYDPIRTSDVYALFIPRIMHVWFASWTAGSALMLSVSAWYLLRKRHVEIAKANLLVALPFFIVFSILNALMFGPVQSTEVTNNQPLKLASMEGLWQSQSCAPLYLVGWVNTTTRNNNRYQHSLFVKPGWLYRNPQAVVTGLNDFPANLYPPINLVFQVYHFMFNIGFLLIPIGVLGSDLVFLETQSVPGRLVIVAVCRHRLPGGNRHHRRLVDGRSRSPALDRL